MQIPEQGRPAPEVLETLEAMRAQDANWREGRTFSLVYHGGDALLGLLKDAFFKYFSENALNPMAFPSLRRMETEVVQMVGDLLGHPEAVGSMTTGGTESILMAVKTARDYARSRGIVSPEMVLPISVHPAFEKAAHYFDVKAVHVPVREDFRADVDAMRAALTPNTVLLVGSAPAYPQGVVDPITEIAALALEHDLLCHVDACLGGMLLPFVRDLGHAVPDFDFRVPGVTSMSCDLHKYGYAAKGASVVLYRTRELRKHQFVVYADWTGGLYGSPTMCGTRAGGPMAAAWAVLNYLGRDGYLRMARSAMDTASILQAGINATPGLQVLGRPHMAVFAFTADDADIFRVGEGLAERGWSLDRQNFPNALHLMITAAHEGRSDHFLEALRAAHAVAVAEGPATSGAAAMYGMLGSLPDRGMVRDFILDFMDGLDRT